jgi:hypothetical protein
MGHDVIKAGYYDLSVEMGGDYANFQAATYATILIGGDAGTFPIQYTSSGALIGGQLWAFVFDWDDSTVNGVPDYYNTTTEVEMSLQDTHTVEMVTTSRLTLVILAVSAISRTATKVSL